MSDHQTAITSIGAVITKAAKYLLAAGLMNHEREAVWLLEGIQGIPDSGGISTSSRELLSGARLHLYEQRLQRRAGGEPLQYILGNVDFHGLRIEVGPGVLIPRPETETLVMTAVELYPGHGNICDMCTGSGAVALALAAALPKCPEIIAVDISETALNYARRNREQLQMPTVKICRSDLFAEFADSAKFAVITANPPYIATEDYLELTKDVKEFEPETALHAGTEGLDILKRIIADAPTHLIDKGWLICECDTNQTAAVSNLYQAAGFNDIRIISDCFRHPRIIAAQT